MLVLSSTNCCGPPASAIVVEHQLLWATTTAIALNTIWLKKPTPPAGGCCRSGPPSGGQGRRRVCKAEVPAGRQVGPWPPPHYHLISTHMMMMGGGAAAPLSLSVGPSLSLRPSIHLVNNRLQIFMGGLHWLPAFTHLAGPQYLAPPPPHPTVPP